MEESLSTTKQTMSSREIAELTEKRHDHVIRDVRKLNESYEKLNLPKVGAVDYIDAKGEKRLEYQLTKIQTFDLMTGYNTELRIRVNRRWEQLENESQNDELIILRGYELLQSRVAEQQLQLAAANKKIALDAPRVNYVQSFFEANGTMSVGEMAKTFGIKPNTMFQRLRDDGYLMVRISDRNIAKQHYIDAGYFEIKITVKNGNQFRQTRVTPRGHAYFAKKYNLFSMALVNPI